MAAREHFLCTLNNYTDAELGFLRGPLPGNITYLLFGYEVAPTTGTPHLQMYAQISKKTKWSTIKNYPGWTRVANMQNALGSDEQNYVYCTKTPGFFEQGVRKTIPPSKPGKRNDINAIKDAVDKGDSYDEICEKHFETMAKYSRFIKERVQARDSGRQQNALKEQFTNAVLKPWQQLLLDVLQEDPCPRKIHWIWETTGNVGKSWMANFLGCKLGATVLTSGKKVDMAFIYAMNPSKIVIFDLSRTTEPTEGKHFLDGVYSLAEDLKNGRVTSTKYESKTIYFPTPHVVFFANYPPDMTKWSADRYFITHL